MVVGLLLYCDETRASLKEKNKDKVDEDGDLINMDEELARGWKDLDESQREEFQAREEHELSKYQEEKEAYQKKKESEEEAAADAAARAGSQSDDVGKYDDGSCPIDGGASRGFCRCGAGVTADMMAVLSSSSNGLGCVGVGAAPVLSADAIVTCNPAELFFARRESTSVSSIERSAGSLEPRSGVYASSGWIRYDVSNAGGVTDRLLLVPRPSPRPRPCDPDGPRDECG